MTHEQIHKQTHGLKHMHLHRVNLIHPQAANCVGVCACLSVPSCILVCLIVYFAFSEKLVYSKRSVIVNLQLTKKIEQFVGTSRKHCGILTLPWRWRSQAGSTCRQGNNWSQKFPGPPSWWPFPQRRKQRCSRPTPGMFWKLQTLKKQQKSDYLSTEKGQVLVMCSHQYGETFWKKLQRCQRRLAKKKVLSPFVSFIPAGNSSGLALLWLCFN